MANKEQYAQRLKARTQVLHKKLTSKIIVSVNAEEDTMTIDGPEGMSKPIPIHHPFLGLDSWIRSGPSRGSGVRVFQRLSDDNDLIQGYYFPNRKELVAQYRAKKGVYRPILPGEHEVSSSGFAQTFWSSRGRHEARGGIINQWLDNDTLESGTHSPIHRRKLHSNASNTVKDEERFGVVTRPTSAIKSKYIKIDDKFAKEYLRVFNDGDNNTLIDHREGHVIDDSGTPIKGSFGNPLRFRKKVFSSNNNPFTLEIDSDGNFSVELPNDASDGGTIDIPSGALKINIDKELEITASGNTLKMNEDGIELKVGTVGPTFKMSSDGVTINGHFLVYKEFLDYFGQTHLTSTGIGFVGWPVMHNPGSTAAFQAQFNIPGVLKSDIAIL